MNDTLLGEIEGDVEGYLEGIIEAVMNKRMPAQRLTPEFKDVAIAVGRQSSRLSARLAREYITGVETRTQSFRVFFPLDSGTVPPSQPLNANVTYSTAIFPDTSYDLVTGMFVVMDTPDPGATPGTIFNPYIGISNNQTIIKDLAPRTLYMVDAQGTTPVNDRFTRLELDLSNTTGRNLILQTSFVTAPGFAIAVPTVAVLGAGWGYTVTLELARAKRRVRG